MSSKNKKTASSIRSQKEKTVVSRLSNAVTFQGVLENSLAAIDELITREEYVYALDLICLDLQHATAKEHVVTEYEHRLLNTIIRLCAQHMISVGVADLGSLRSLAPLRIVQLVSSTSIRASLACSTFPVSLWLKREFTNAVDQSYLDLGRKQLNDPKTQAYEKRKILVDTLERLEADIERLLRSDLTVELVGALRQTFMKLVKSPMAQAAIWPFVSEEIRSEVRLAQLFQSVSALADAGPEDLLEVFKNASEILNTFIRESEQLRTHYSWEIFAKLGRLLTRALEDYMAVSPLAQPARIEVAEIKKKYPLSLAGTTLSMTFQVKNTGLGPAQEVLFRVDEIGAVTLQAEKKEWYLGTVAETAVDICVPIIVKEPSNETAISTSVAWKNFDNSEGTDEFVFDLRQQRTDVDWGKKQFMDPYSLEPIEYESELIGRADVLAELASLAYARSVGSCYLYGQKRVGKTSVVKTLRNKLQNQGEGSPVVIYLERGEFAGTDPIATIVSLGEKLCQQLKECDPRFNYIESPIFKDTLVPLNTFLEDIARIAPHFRALFILDEFDELPIDLYKRTPIGDAFFGSLRSLTSKPSFGLILVGSENMRHVIHLQGHALNKFQTIELDYFERQRHWADFQELVRQPVHGISREEEKARIQSEEILEVIEKWQAHYKGRKISEDSVRAWLNQFGDATRQRLAFIILQGLKFYTATEIRAKVKEAHGIVVRDLVQVVEKGRVKRSDILVSYLDGAWEKWGAICKTLC